MPLGPVIGPLVMCGYLVNESKLDELKKIGVKDSKLVTPRKREFLEKKLEKMAIKVIIHILNAKDIDKLRGETNLNRIEARNMKDIINKTNPDRVYIDSIESNTSKFRMEIVSGLNDKLKAKMKEKKLDVICENFADKKYLPVGAASIIAKVNRDRIVDEIKKEYGNFGSGYATDPRTINFLKDWIKKNKNYPEFVRRSWMTAKTIKNDHEQRSLKDLIK